MKKITITLYSFDELSEQAQKYAYETWWENAEYYWFDDMMKPFRIICDELNFTIKNYSIGLYSHSFIDVEQEDDIDIEPWTETKNRIIERIKEQSGYWFDEDIIQELEKPFDGDLDTLVRRLAIKTIQGIEDDIKHEMSFEAFKEHCGANEYTFEENGVMRNF